MNSLQLMDIPSIRYDQPEFFLWIVMALCVWLSFTAPIIALPKKVPSFFVTIYVMVSLTLVASAFWAYHHDNLLKDEREGDYGRSSALIVEKNVSAVVDWVNSTYVVTLDEISAKRLLLATPYYATPNHNSRQDEFSGHYYFSVGRHNMVGAVGDTYVKTVSGEMLQVKLVWSGEKYVLLQMNDVEVERR